MESNKDELKIILEKAINDEINERNDLENYEIVAKKITEENYFVLFDVMEAHYLANNMMDNYKDDMYHLVKNVIIEHWLNETVLPVGEAIAEAVDVFYQKEFDEDEMEAIKEEIIEKINGLIYLDKGKAKSIGKKYVTSFQDGNFI